MLASARNSSGNLVHNNPQVCAFESILQNGAVYISYSTVQWKCSIFFAEAPDVIHYSILILV